MVTEDEMLDVTSKDKVGFFSVNSKLIPTCPGCQNELHRVEGRFGPFWGCNCGFIFPEEVFGVKTTADDLHMLCIGAETREYLFTWSSGKKSRAKMFYDKDKNRIGYKMSK